MSSIIALSIATLHEKLKSRDISAVELTHTYLEEIKKRDGEIHAYLRVMEDTALEQAKEADDLFALGEIAAGEFLDYKRMD